MTLKGVGRWSSKVKDLVLDHNGRSSNKGSRPNSIAGSSRASSPSPVEPSAANGIAKSPKTDERLLIFPGWATRKYVHGFMPNAENQFTIELFVSGYVAAFTRPESATRAQKALLYAAKNFATLPKLVKQIAQHNAEPEPEPIMLNLSPSTEELLATKKLPPRPTEMTDELERIALAQMYDDETTTQFVQDSLNHHQHDPTANSNDDSAELLLPILPAMDTLHPDEIRKLHLNLHTRLRQFWSTALCQRTIRLEVYVEGDPDEALLTQDVLTDAQGGFAAKLHVPWERMVAHPLAQHVANGEATAAHFVRVTAELLPPPPAIPTVPQSAPPSVTSFSMSSVSTYSSENGSTTSASNSNVKDAVVLPLTYTRVRLISDIDDTVKNSDILRGARTVFRNVFVKHLDDVVIREMSDWYQSLYARGVRFHYVSNSPWELLPVLSEFIRVSNLPEGSLRLKWYGGVKQLFTSGLLEPADQRKRAGVQEVLDAFLDCQFILVGDSGEKDMELYASLAQERPFQVLAIFVRDVTSPALNSKAADIAAKEKEKEKDKAKDLKGLEEKRLEFAERVRRAPELVPRHIVFRLFSDPAECVEAHQLLDGMDIR